MTNYKVNTNSDLYHHGILGQRWGVRRYQNKDGSLTAAGKKKVSEDYKKNMSQAKANMKSSETQLYVDAYNDVADRMNNGGIDKYNADYHKKLKKKGIDPNKHDFLNDDDYNYGYINMYNKLLEKKYNELYDQKLSSDPSYIEAQRLVKKYGADKL